MVKEASHSLFNATRQRLYIRGAKILIPITWSLNANYTNRTRERYEKADIIIANTSQSMGDAPYTRQYGGCGKPGRYIHLTPNFLRQANLTSFYGPYGKVFVHEWAHLRWGVFEEHNNDQPFYFSGKGQVEATRCSAALTGTYRVRHTHIPCKTRPCSIDPVTGLFAAGCTFLPEETSSSAAASIMYSPGLPSVSGFCDETNHNTEAPTMQNRLCDGHSTWDIIKDHNDVVSSEPRDVYNMPEPTISVLRYRERVITLLIDVSKSMSTNNRLGRVRQAADVFLTESIARGTYIGIVEISMYAFPQFQLRQITNDSVRERLKSDLPDLPAQYSADFCTGILKAFEVNRKSGSSHGTEIIFLADGQDIALYRCFPAIKESGAIIHTIALSDDATKYLEEIADMTGGLKYFVMDQVGSSDLIDVFIKIANENGGNSSRTSQIESATFNVNPEECVSGTVYIDSTVGAETFFTVTWQDSNISITLKAPNGMIYSTANFIPATKSKLSRLRIAGAAVRGAWAYTFCNNHTQAQVLGLVVTSKSIDVNEPPIIVDVHMNSDTNNPPDPMIVYASVSRGLLPVKGAKVTALITSEKGNRTELELLDNGAGADIVKDDGVYSRYFFRFSVNGRYSLNVRVTCGERECRPVRPKNRVLYLPGFVDNGTVMMTPTPPAEDDILPVPGPIQRIAAGESFRVSNVGDTKTDEYPPGKITDLQAKRIEDGIVLSWTAPGDDLDQGNAASYKLRVSTAITELRESAGSLPVVIITNPKPSGSRENFTYTPGQDIAVYYFAVTALDKDGKEPISYYTTAIKHSKTLLGDIAWKASEGLSLLISDALFPYTICTSHLKNINSSARFLQGCQDKRGPYPKL
ncbi:calcium-activated chloride channel regulator 1-like [Dendropsophus ebraccatus]|uniref:calcium-activated chloride channel regulator 1-like n=1 Tax=Dendropsophus ebraccatus TaxID=150705 RepID=UPI003831FB1B